VEDGEESTILYFLFSRLVWVRNRSLLIWPAVVDGDQQRDENQVLACAGLKPQAAE